MEELKDKIRKIIAMGNSRPCDIGWALKISANRAGALIREIAKDDERAKVLAEWTAICKQRDTQGVLK